MSTSEIESHDSRRVAARGRWKLGNAKARFSEFVWLAQNEEPQRVSVRGRDTVIVMDVQDLENLGYSDFRVGGGRPYRVSKARIFA